MGNSDHGRNIYVYSFFGALVLCINPTSSLPVLQIPIESRLIIYRKPKWRRVGGRGLPDIDDELHFRPESREPLRRRREEGEGEEEGEAVLRF